MLLYHQLLSRLTSRYDQGEARAVLRLLLEDHFGLLWTDVLCGDVHLTTLQEADLERLLQRLEAGEPVQYVMGEAAFCGRHFDVAPGVLIPRPETERLVEIAVEALSAAKGHQTATADSPAMTATEGVASPCCLDIGTGSGCIAVTVALECAAASVEALDISDKALLIAQRNAERHGVRVAFRKEDILTAAAPTARYDVIVSNPPYICHREAAEMEQHVLDHEPALALFVPDDDALLFYRHIGLYATSALKPGGTLAVETNRLYADATAQLFEQLGLVNVRVETDCFGEKRFVVGCI